MAISADGTIVAVGYPGWNQPGLVKVFKWNQVGRSWTRMGNDTQITGTVGGALGVGHAVALTPSGTILAVGAPRGLQTSAHPLGSWSKSGSVLCYAWNGAEWVPVGGAQDMTPVLNPLFNSQNVGQEVSISHDGNVIASTGKDGYLYVYDLVNNGSTNATTWVPRPLRADMVYCLDSQDFTSLSMSGDGNVVAIGCPFESQFRGITRVFEWLPATREWIQRGGDAVFVWDTSVGRYIQTAGDLQLTGKMWPVSWGLRGQQCGSALALSADASVMAVGCYSDSETAQSDGIVYMFAWNGSAWNRFGGTGADDDLLRGRSLTAGAGVALTPDGSIVAIGDSGYNSWPIEDGGVTVLSCPPARSCNAGFAHADVGGRILCVP